MENMHTSQEVLEERADRKHQIGALNEGIEKKEIVSQGKSQANVWRMSQQKL